ncbi:AAA family ATPase [Sinorhizobium sp. BG8]|uniref:ParA family protein n=1 Tax=Sinorhizobium sp. BG8 TaxID=2613773 RepID=UPI00193D7D15|nr:AAA family ATPase [Sinorhizobium sp. BG8]QRM55738.1 AAA family ATPase [Sinorhizobium sp. BG8]
MKSIAFFNNKGGVGKTTLLCNVAAYLGNNLNKKVLVIDADPQCNATQLMLSDEEILNIYEDRNSYTIHNIIHPLSLGKGYNEQLKPISVPSYAVDLICGDPRLSLKEDLLSKDWQDSISGSIRGLRTSFLFQDVLERCGDYDYVLFDVGPSLGSINRAVLLASDYFISPMSIDIFSLRAIENISIAINEWRKRLEIGISQVDKEELDELPKKLNFNLQFLGYVAQQYTQKTVDGESRVVHSYERIMKQIPKVVSKNFVEKLSAKKTDIEYRLGTIPNLHSLVPMSQTARKPIFLLKSKDGVRGAHFSKVEDAKNLFDGIASKIEANARVLNA